MKIAGQELMAKRIKERRKSLKYTQEQFAELLGIATSSYTRIENAFQKPSLDTVIKIAEHLKTTIDYIVLGKNNDLVAEATDTEKMEALLGFTDKNKIKHAVEVLNKLLKMQEER